MSNNEYSPKELLVFEGMLNLAREGKFSKEIKTDDIAKKAGIGKGTLYNYFSSKEEIIKKTILFYMQQKFEQVYLSLNTLNSFKDMCYKIFDAISALHAAHEDLSAFLSALTQEEIMEYMKSCYNQKNLNLDIQEIFTKLITLGKNEKLITNNDKDYICWVFLSAFASLFALTQPCVPNIANKSDKTLKEYTYKMIINALDNE